MRSSGNTAAASPCTNPARGELCTSMRTDWARAAPMEQAAARPSTSSIVRAYPGSCRKRIAYPFDPGRVESVHQHDVEAAGRVLLSGQPPASGRDDARLLALVH